MTLSQFTPKQQTRINRRLQWWKRRTFLASIRAETGFQAKLAQMREKQAIFDAI